MEVTLITLSENSVSKPGFLSEWGLSILVQVDQTKILFDTGGSNILIENARNLGVDLSKVDKIVLSHGHADHTGGLRDVLKSTGEVEIIAHPNIWEAKYTKRFGENKATYIGIPYIKEELEYLGANFTYSKESVAITNKILTTGEIEMLNDFEEIESNLYIKEKGELKPDPFHDDLSLIVKTEKGLIIILGCAHKGIINHIWHAQKITGENRIYAVVGGTHLGLATDKRIDNTINELKKLKVKQIGVSHCTGFHASARLAQEFPGEFFLNNAGTFRKLL